jgi:hypothetical protein
MAGDQIRVSRSLYLSALDDAIDWQASLLASQRHSPDYPGGPSCCAPGARCETYRETAVLLARYRKARAGDPRWQRAGQNAVTALTAANARIGALVRAVLTLEYPLPVPTTAVAERVSYRHDPAVYRALARMEHQGDIEKISVPDVKCRYWRLAEPPATRSYQARERSTPVPGHHVTIAVADGPDITLTASPGSHYVLWHWTDDDGDRCEIDLADDAPLLGRFIEDVRLGRVTTADFDTQGNGTLWITSWGGGIPSCISYGDPEHDGTRWDLDAREMQSLAGALMLSPASWPGPPDEQEECGHEYVLGGIAYGCERAPHLIDGHGPAFRHAAGIDAELAEGTDEGDGHGPATLVTWGEDGNGEGQDWEIDWGTIEDYAAPGRSWRGTRQ